MNIVLEIGFEIFMLPAGKRVHLHKMIFQLSLNNALVLVAICHVQSTCTNISVLPEWHSLISSVDEYLFIES